MNSNSQQPAGQLARMTALASWETSRKMYFFARSSWESARNIRPVYGPVQKLGVVLEASAPWENGEVATFASALVRTEAGTLRLYYTYLDAIQHEKMQIGLAESHDGITWRRVALGQKFIDGHNTNLLHFGGLEGDQTAVCQPQVLRLPDGTWRMYFWKHGDGHVRYAVAESADGLSWSVPDIERPALYHPGDKTIKFDWAKGLATFEAQGGAEGEAGLRAKARSLMTNDATYVYYNDNLKRFECYTVWLASAHPDRRVEDDNCPGISRVIQRRLSMDGLSWGDPELILRPDDQDPWDQQFYHMAVQWHEDWMIGSLGHYRVEGGQQTQDLELAFSRDGRSWERPVRGGFIPRGRDERDSAGVYPPGAWIERGGEWLCLYSGTTRRHNQFGDNARHLPLSCIMAATFSKDRLVGLAAGDLSGGFLTEPFFLRDEHLSIDAHIRGWLRAELCDMWGRKLPGFHLMDSELVRGDSKAHSLRWGKQSLANQAHTAVRLRFEYVDGEIYKVGF